MYLGVDGGGTHTRALLVDQDGRFLGYGTAGPSNYDDVGVERAQAALSAAVGAAHHMADQRPQPCKAAFLGLAGVVSAADEAVIHQIASTLDLAPSDAIGIDHDIRIALAGGLNGRPGIALIAGTGSACYGRNQAGESWRAGGWGQLIGDEGSSYWLGIEALKAAVAAYDGRGTPSPLLDAVLDQLNLEHINHIMHRLYSDGLSRTEIAALAPSVVATAEGGDSVAGQLLDQGAQELARCVIAVAHHLHLRERSELVLIGGLLTKTDAVSGRLATLLSRQLSTCQIVPANLSPVAGAALLALQQDQIKLDAAVLANLQAADRLISEIS